MYKWDLLKDSTVFLTVKPIIVSQKYFINNVASSASSAGF